MASLSIARIQRLNYAIAAVAVAAAALTQSPPVALGLAIGAGLTCVNFVVLGKLIAKWTTDAAAGRSSAAPLLMMPKMLALMGAVAVAILLLPIDIIAFLVGYSIFLVSIVIETTYAALRGGPAPTPASPTSPSPGPSQPTKPSEHIHG